MKIYIACESKQSLGGGWSFISNFTKGVTKLGHEIVDLDESDIILIPSSSMITKETFRSLRKLGKKIVLRNDNLPRNSRNSGCGTNRLKEMSEGADAIVYQSKWARDYIMPFVGRDGEIIINGIDQDIFKNNNSDRIQDSFLYSRFSRDETKMWEVAWYEYQMIHRSNPESKLFIVGRYADEIVSNNFDFYNGEDIQYLGVVEDAEEMSRIYNSIETFLMTYYNDACSNTLIEALCCGCNLVVNDIAMTGGTPEILEIAQKEGMNAFSLDRMCNQYINLFTSL